MKIEKGIWQSELVRNVTKLLSANVLTQAIGLLLYPLLTRMYSQDAFGLLSLFVSMGSVLALVATAEYQYAIVLPKSEDVAKSVFRLGGTILVSVTLLVVLSIPFAPQISLFFKAPALADWYVLLPLYVFLMGFWALLNYWYNRHKQFGRIGSYQVSQSVLIAGSKVGFGAAGFLRGGLIVSSVLGPLLSILAVSGKSIVLRVKRCLRREEVVSRADALAGMRAAAREYKNFPLYSLPRSLVNNVSANLGVWMLTPAFGLERVGVFGLAVTLAFRPLNVLCTSIYQVLFQRTSERVRDGQSIRLIFRHLLTKTALVAGVLFAGLFFVLPPLCGWLLGEGWRETGELIRLFLPWLFFSILVAPICFLSDVFGKQKIALVLEILLIAARAAGLLWGIWCEDFHRAVLGYSLGGALVIGIQLLWYVSLIRRYERTLS